MISFGAALGIFLLLNTATAFVSPSTACSAGISRCLETAAFTNRSSLPREFSTRRFAALDDEDDDDEEEEDEQGPLSKGIDSVSWLPSVAGAKGDNTPITSTKEVREITALIYYHTMYTTMGMDGYGMID